MMDILKELKSKQPPKCPACGLSNKCGVDLGKGYCWCFSLSARNLHNIQFTKDDGCLCESCLNKYTTP